MKKATDHYRFFNKFSSIVTKATGHPFVFMLALVLILVWAALGPFVGFSENWQLVINTGTTIITFLMVFVIQQSQNRETLAIQLKLNELIAMHELASNRLIDVEDLTEGELEALKKFYVKLAKLSQKEHHLHSSHSIDEANAIHAEKIKTRRHPKSLSTSKSNGHK